MSLVHRTPDDRFADLAGYTFAPKFIEDLPSFSGLRTAADEPQTKFFPHNVRTPTSRTHTGPA